MAAHKAEVTERIAARAVVFDAYGTLFDINAGRALVARLLGDARADRVLALWRAKQLEYSWLVSLMGDYRPFSALTRSGLAHAFAAEGIDDPLLMARLLDHYKELPAYDDARPCLSALRALGLRTAILSNGERDHVARLSQAAGLSSLCDEIISVEEAQIFKPSAATYALACARLDCRGEQIVFISSNGWDVSGAVRFGLSVIWLNRQGRAAEQLDLPPRAVISDLAALPARLAPISS